MNKQTRSYLTAALMASLTIALIAQSVYLARLNSKLDSLESSASTADNHFDPLATSATSGPSWPDPIPYNDPFARLLQMQNQMDRLFGPAFGNGSRFSGGVLGAAASPGIEVSESDNDYQIVIDVPENGELELSTEIEDNSIWLAGSVNFSGSQNISSPTPSFTSTSQFSRSIPLSQEVDPLAMQTDQTDNAVVITIPKA